MLHFILMHVNAGLIGATGAVFIASVLLTATSGVARLVESRAERDAQRERLIELRRRQAGTSRTPWCD